MVELEESPKNMVKEDEVELPSENVLIWVTVNPTGTMHLGTEGMRWIFSFKVCRKVKINPPTSVFVRFSVQLVVSWQHLLKRIFK